jgi:hypothetical protein
VGLRVQEIEQRPDAEVGEEERGDLIEAHDEARRPASAQQRELEAAAQIAREACEQPRWCRGCGRLKLAIR